MPSNIAEGRLRFHRKEYLHFLSIAFGSGAELETQLTLARTLPGMDHLEYGEVENLLNEVMRMLNAMIAKMGVETPSQLES